MALNKTLKNIQNQIIIMNNKCNNDIEKLIRIKSNLETGNLSNNEYSNIEVGIMKNIEERRKYKKELYIQFKNAPELFRDLFVENMPISIDDMYYTYCQYCEKYKEKNSHNPFIHMKDCIFYNSELLVGGKHKKSTKSTKSKKFKKLNNSKKIKKSNIK